MRRGALAAPLGPGRRKLSLKKLRKPIDNLSILCYTIDTVKKGRKKAMMMYRVRFEDGTHTCWWFNFGYVKDIAITFGGIIEEREVFDHE
jgi:hypothetical protein